ncbi:MAG: hypothetical protein ACFNKE_09650, partial [Neisseria elongata]
GVDVITQVCGQEPEPGHTMAPTLGNVPGGMNGRKDSLNLLLDPYDGTDVFQTASAALERHFS